MRLYRDFNKIKQRYAPAVERIVNLIERRQLVDPIVSCVLTPYVYVVCLINASNNPQE